VNVRDEQLAAQNGVPLREHVADYVRQSHVNLTLRSYTRLPGLGPCHRPRHPFRRPTGAGKSNARAATCVIAYRRRKYFAGRTIRGERR
jgi:hypothetical protein